jgi:hypothetical protein
MSKAHIPVEQARRLERLLGGNAAVENMVSDFIAEKWNADCLLELPSKVADSILARPNDFLRQVKKRFAPSVDF